jgi:hypothetical protein
LGSYNPQWLFEYFELFKAKNMEEFPSLKIQQATRHCQATPGSHNLILILEFATTMGITFETVANNSKVRNSKYGSFGVGVDRDNIF